MVPVKDSKATIGCHEAELLSLRAAPLEVHLLLRGVTGKGGVVVPAPTGICSPGASKRSEITATYAHHGLHQHRTGTHWLSHDTLYPLPSNTVCTKRNREPPSEGSTTNKLGINTKADTTLLTILIYFRFLATGLTHLEGWKYTNAPVLSCTVKPMTPRRFGRPQLVCFCVLFFSIKHLGQVISQISQKFKNGHPFSSP